MKVLNWWSTKPGVEVGADAEQNVDHKGEYNCIFIQVDSFYK